MQIQLKLNWEELHWAVKNPICRIGSSSSEEREKVTLSCDCYHGPVVELQIGTRTEEGEKIRNLETSTESCC